MKLKNYYTSQIRTLKQCDLKGIEHLEVANRDDITSHPKTYLIFDLAQCDSL